MDFADQPPAGKEVVEQSVQSEARSLCQEEEEEEESDSFDVEASQGPTSPKVLSGCESATTALSENHGSSSSRSSSVPPKRDLQSSASPAGSRRPASARGATLSDDSCTEAHTSSGYASPARKLTRPPVTPRPVVSPRLVVTPAKSLNSKSPGGTSTSKSSFTLPSSSKGSLTQATSGFGNSKQNPQRLKRAKTVPCLSKVGQQALQKTSDSRNHKKMTSGSPQQPGGWPATLHPIEGLARYVFWTGGYDSTFRILELLLSEKCTVVPIYLSGDIDNFVQEKHKRQSKDFELNAIHSIRREILRCFPDEGIRLKDLTVIPEVCLSKEVKLNMQRMTADKLLGRWRCQYCAMAQLSLNMAVPMDVSVVKGDRLWRALHEHLEHTNEEHYLSEHSIKLHPHLSIFQWFRFPLVEYSKTAMLEVAKNRGYDQFLRMTWTCWFPQNGAPCHKCAMCKHRIL